jgi:hypothetical protein
MARVEAGSRLCGAGTPAQCHILSPHARHHSWIVGQDCILRAGFQPALVVLFTNDPAGLPTRRTQRVPLQTRVPVPRWWGNRQNQCTYMQLLPVPVQTPNGVSCACIWSCTCLAKTMSRSPFNPDCEVGGRVATAAPGNEEPQFIDWESIESGKGLTVLRDRVPGGWLVYASNSFHHHGGLTFYPDPEHQWNGGSLPPNPE